MPPTSTAADEQLQRIQIASLFLESLLYGMFLISFFFALRTLIFEEGFRRKKKVHWYLVAIAGILFSLATVDLVLGLVRVLRLDVHSKPTGVDTMLVIGVFIVVVIVDAVLVYRCWVVYLRSWKAVVFPALLWMGTTATVIYYTYISIALHVGTPVNTESLEHSLESILSLTIAQNIISTGLIAGRIWSIDRQSAQYRTDRSGGSHTQLKMVTRIVIDSGLLCTLSAVASFTAFWTDKNAGYICSDAEIQLVSMAFNLIIVRTANSRADEYALPTPRSALELAVRVPPSVLSQGEEMNIHVSRNVISTFDDYRPSESAGKKQDSYL